MEKVVRRKFTDEFKEGAVKLVTEQGYKISEAARNLGINANQLRRWVKGSLPDSNPASVSSQFTSKAFTDVLLGQEITISNRSGGVNFFSLAS